MGMFRKILQPLWVCGVIIGVVSAGFALIGGHTYQTITLNQNKLQMERLTQQTVQRLELLADYAVITLSDLAAEGLSQCDAASLIEIRKSIYLRGAVKDVQVFGVGDKLRCAGIAQAREFGVGRFDLGHGYAGSNTSITFHTVSSDDSGLLGVAWRFGEDLTFLAVLNVDSLLFDVFPSVLRDGSEAEFLLGEKTVFAQNTGMIPDDVEADSALTFSASSQRYPLTAQLTLDPDILAEWNYDSAGVIMIVAAILGLIISLLGVILLRRPEHPVEVLKEAMLRGEFVPFMQPIFSVKTGEVVGCEVLTRWAKSDGSIAPPHQFIPLAESSGLIVPITRMIIRRSLKEMKTHLSANKGFKIAFNIVPEDLVSSDFAQDICDIVREAGVSRAQVVLELTERQEFSDLASAIVAIKKLKELGFRISLDDTGTGHNGLSYVQQLGADIIKIDKHFVDRVGADKAATTIVQMLVRLACEMNMRTVAEGIETEKQLDTLKECGVDEGQGYLVSPPLPREAFMKLVAEREEAVAVKTAA